MLPIPKIAPPSLVLVAAGLLSAQEVREDWRTGLGSANVALDRHHDVFLTSSAGQTGADQFVTKLDERGRTLWTRRHGDPAHAESTRWLAVDSRGNVLITGHRSWASGGPGGFLTAKFDTDGNLLWSRLLQTNGEGYRIEVDENDDVYVAGRNYTTALGFHFLTVKYDAQGNLLWQRIKNLVEPTAMAVGHGRVAVVGSSPQMGLVVYDLQGNELFSDVFPSAQGAEDVVIRADRSVVMCGTAVGLNAVVACYDAGGTRAWSHQEPGPFGPFGRFKRLAVDGTGGLIAVGHGSSQTAYQDWLVARLDPAGNRLWARGHDGFPGNEEWALAVSIGPGDEAYVAGLAGVPTATGGRGLGTVVIRYDVAGGIDWIHEAQDSGSRPVQVIPDSFGEVVVGGGTGTAPVLRLLQREWRTLGNDLPGTHGMADLEVRGYLDGSGPLSFGVRGALPGAAGVLAIGASRIDRPLFGGLVVPSLDLLVPLAIDAAGAASLGATLPSFVPIASEFYVQAWIVDPGAPGGFAASDAVMKALQ